MKSGGKTATQSLGSPQSSQNQQSPRSRLNLRSLAMLALANMRKAKGQTASLFALILVAAGLLNMGLLILLDFGDTFERRFEVLGASHCAIIEPQAAYSDEQLEWLGDYPGTTEARREDARAFMTDFAYGGGTNAGVLFFLNAEGTQALGTLSLIEGSEPRAPDEVCVPYLFKVGGGYALGDTLSFSSNGQRHSYRISGFSEAILFGSPTNTTYELYLSGQGYNELAAATPAAASVLLGARMAEPLAGETIRFDFIREFFYHESIPGAATLLTVSMDFSAAKLSRTFMSGITSTILVVFSALIVLICLIVIRFRIQNSIEEGMGNIGALKALGYTNKQVRGAFVLQFGGVCALAGLVGIAASYALLPLVAAVLEQQTALIWEQGLDPVISGLAWLGTLAAVLAVTFTTTRRVRKLQPLEALRGGLTTHSFRRNPLSLSATPGPLVLLLALKSALRGKGQLVMIALIVALLSFTCAGGLSIYYNMGVDSRAFMNMIGGEVPDIQLTLAGGISADEARQAFDDIKADGAVRKAFTMQNINIKVLVDDDISNNIVCEDFSLLEGTMLYQGRYPLHDNEVALSSVLSRRLGRGIGDGTYDLILNIQEVAQAQLGSFSSLFAALAAAILVVTLLVIVLVLYLVLRTAILRRRRDFGIQKALGFTTLQLMNQVTLGFLPAVAVGLLAGALAAALGFNSVCVALLSTMGIVSVSLPVPGALTLAMCVGLVAAAYAASLIITLGIRKISAYALISE